MIFPKRNLRKFLAIWPHVLAFAFIVGLESLFSNSLGSEENDDLVVIVSGLRSQEGNVHIALYDDPDQFPDPNGMIDTAEATIIDGTARHNFTGLPSKRYAIAVYHDENDNDEFDQGFLGIPLEDYAFSNNAKVFLGPPSFDDAAFILTTPIAVTIQLNR